MKEELKAFLKELGHQVHDFGTNSEDAVDYPDFAYAVARQRFGRRGRCRNSDRRRRSRQRDDGE